MKFTKEEISLCKQVAEKYRRVVEEGDYLSFIDKTWLVYHTTGPWISVISRGAKHAISTNLDDKNEWFPLWTISDCLEFLRDKVSGAHLVTLEVSSKEGNDKCACCIFDPSACDQKEYIFLGKTPLEACLKAVLALLWEK